MRFFYAAVCLSLMMTLPSASYAQSRVALVVGNGDYQHTAKLPNPVNDAGDISGALRRLNFDVTTITNARYDDMRRAVISFSQKARGSEIAVVFFAGHGAEIAGQNYLIPIDARLATDLDTPNEAISLERLMSAVSTSTKLGMVVLDACRNNPFLNKMQRTAGVSRSVDRGFARVEPSGNIMVAYAAAAGTTAKDGTGRNSPFTASLLGNIETPGLEIGYLFRVVREDVIVATRNEQQPFVYGALGKESIYLKPSASGADAKPPKPTPPVVATIAPTGGNVTAVTSLNPASPNPVVKIPTPAAYSDWQLYDEYKRLCDALSRQGAADGKYIANSLLSCNIDLTPDGIRNVVASACASARAYCHGPHRPDLLEASSRLQCPVTGRSCE